MKLDAFLICDDIRPEAGNKLSILGIYTDQVLFNADQGQVLTWPQLLKISFFIRFAIEPSDSISGPISFKLYSEANGEKLPLGEGTIKEPNMVLFSKKIVIAANFMGYIIKAPGIITYSIEFFDQTGRVILNNTVLGSMNFGEATKG